MRTRSSWTFGILSTLLSLTFVGVAQAQNATRGQQLERQIMNDVGNAISGRQPNYPSPNPPSPSLPYYNPSQGPQPGYAMPGSQPQVGRGYYPQGGAGYQQFQQGYYQQPQRGYYQQSASGSSMAQRYQLPAQFAGAAPGSVVSYGGASYLIGNDGTMTAYSGPDQPPSNTRTGSTGAVASQRYQIPAQYAGTAPGYVISYGGRNYLTGNGR